MISNANIHLPSLFQYALYIPFVTIVMKVFLIIPPIDWHLTKIRGGWERHGNKAGRIGRAGHYDLERADSVKPVSVMTKPQLLGQAQVVQEIPPVENA